MFYHIGFMNKVLDIEILDRKNERALIALFDRFKTHKGVLLFSNNPFEKSFFIKLDDEDLEIEIKEYLKLLQDNNRLFVVKCVDENECELFNIDYILTNYIEYEKKLLPIELKNRDFYLSISLEEITTLSLKQIFEKVLPYTVSLKIIDPYFIPNFKENILEIIDELLSKFYINYGLEDFGYIEFHVRYNAEYHQKNRRDWKEFLQKTKHQVEVYFWIDTNVRMHDRYLITDFCCIEIGKGLETHTKNYKTFSNWSFLDKAINKIEKQFDVNSSPFKLKDKITKGD